MATEFHEARMRHLFSIQFQKFPNYVKMVGHDYKGINLYFSGANQITKASNNNILVFNILQQLVPIENGGCEKVESFKFHKTFLAKKYT